MKNTLPPPPRPLEGFTEEDFILYLRSQIGRGKNCKWPTLAALAEAKGWQPQHVSGFLTGARHIGDKTAKTLGWTRVVSVRYIPTAVLQKERRKEAAS